MDFLDVLQIAFYIFTAIIIYFIIKKIKERFTKPDNKGFTDRGFAGTFGKCPKCHKDIPRFGNKCVHCKYVW